MFQKIPQGVASSSPSWIEGGRPLFFIPRSLPIQTLPHSVDELIDELDRKVVPETIPSVDATMEEVQRQAGKRELVVFLKTLRDRRDSAPRERKRNR